MKRLSNWIEIPVTNLKRAKEFYQNILQTELRPMVIGPIQYALFPSEDRFNCGALVEGEGYEPSAKGVTVYLDGGDDLDLILQRVKKIGGQILMPKTYLGKDAGFIGFFLDSEGNRIGLQNME
ncbi:MAG: VOC family protein [Treponemataceae bacterium]